MRSEARRVALVLTVAAGLSGCAHSPSPQEQVSSPSSRSASDHIDPGNLKRVRQALPAGYEKAELTGPISVAALWGFGAGWQSQPEQCAAVADPAAADPTARGLSASGPGGTVYVIVAATADVVASNAEIREVCRGWTMTFSHTTGTAEMTEAPVIEGAATLSSSLTARTRVESGMETDTQISTASAYLEGFVVTVTLLTDPGSRHTPLDPHFVNDLLDKTVTALRE